MPEWWTPELGEAAPPLESDAGKLRFYQAAAEVLRLAAAGLGAVAFDDVQFADAASIDASHFVFSAIRTEDGAPLPTVQCYRSAELGPELQTRFLSWARSGVAVHVALAPLSVLDAQALLGSLEVPQLGEQAGDIARACGGNPLALLELARQVLTSPLASPQAGPPQRLNQVFGQRLERLSHDALKLLRAAAVLGSDLSAELAAEMLDCGALDLGRALGRTRSRPHPQWLRFWS